MTWKMMAVMEEYLMTAEYRWGLNWLRNVYAVTFGITHVFATEDHWLMDNEGCEETQALVDRLGGLWRYILRNSNKVIFNFIFLPSLLVSLLVVLFA